MALREYVSQAVWKGFAAVHLRLVRTLSSRREIHGLQVFVFGVEDQVEEAFDKITAALDLIEQHDATRYSRFVSGFDSIVVNEAGGALASSDGPRRMCKMDEKWLVSASTAVESVAATLVHEGTHRHIDSRGVKYRDGRRVRIEGVCFSSEIAFLRRLPDYASDVGRTVFSKRSYSEEVFGYGGAINRRMTALEAMEAPEWLKRWSRRRAERLLARHGT